MATCVVVLLAVPLFWLLQFVLPSMAPFVVLSAVHVAVVYVIRTIFIEIGVRRTLCPREKKLERRGRDFLGKTLGVTFAEDSRDRADQREI